MTAPTHERTEERGWEGIALPLEGSLVVLEPLEAGHEEGLFEAAREDRSVWRWLPYDASESRGAFRVWIVQRGEVRDTAYYSITDDEWPEVESNLRHRLAAGP